MKQVLDPHVYKWNTCSRSRLQTENVNKTITNMTSFPISYNHAHSTRCETQTKLRNRADHKGKSFYRFPDLSWIDDKDSGLYGIRIEINAILKDTAYIYFLG